LALSLKAEASNSDFNRVYDIKESILFLHEELLSQDFTDGDEQNFIGYAKIFACLKELEQLKSNKTFNNQTSN